MRGFGSSPPRARAPPMPSSAGTRFLEWLLTGIVGMPWAAADVEARRLHSSISPEFETRLEEMLGHPQTCPHGNPIDRATEARRPKGSHSQHLRRARRPRSIALPRRPRQTPRCSAISRRAGWSLVQRSPSSHEAHHSIHSRWMARSVEPHLASVPLRSCTSYAVPLMLRSSTRFRSDHE